MNAAQFKILHLLVDVLRHEVGHWNDDMLITDEFYRWVDRSPVASRVAIICAGALLTGHLARLYSADVDPLSRRFVLWKHLRGLSAATGSIPAISLCG
jgi:hypothetical protein